MRSFLLSLLGSLAWVIPSCPAMKVSNPAIWVRPDQSIYVFGRLRDASGVNRGIAFTAPTYAGPYSIVERGENLLPNGGELEDPTLWWAENRLNLVRNLQARLSS